MPSIPLLSDLPAVNRRYEPGDCLIACVTSHLTADQVHKITKAAVKFAGAAVSVAVVNVLSVQLLLTKQNELTPIILTPIPKMETAKKSGMANLDLAKVPFETGDRLYVKTRNTNRQLVYDYFKNWTHGKDIEIFVELVE